MAKNEHIYERKGKKGLTLQIKIPYGPASDRQYFTRSIKAYEYPSKAAAYEAARMVRDQAVVDINNNRSFHMAPTVGELYSEYWEMSTLSINTKDQYRPVYEAVAAPLADVRVDEVSVSDIQKLIADYAENHSEQMIKKAKRVWHTIFLAAQMKGLNISDKTVMLLPVRSRKPVKKNRVGPIISTEDFFRFMEELLAAPSETVAAEKRKKDIWYMLWIMYFTGCRPAEALALNREDIDFDGKLLHIEKSIGSTKKARRQVVATKRSASFRAVPISDDLEPILRSLVEYSDTSPLLRAMDGLPYKIADISYEIHRLMKRLGINFNSYQLRHKFSDDMFDKKVNPVVIRDLMGHASSTMSLEYAKATPEQMSEAVSCFRKKGDS